MKTEQELQVAAVHLMSRWLELMERDDELYKAIPKDPKAPNYWEAKSAYQISKQRSNLCYVWLHCFQWAGVEGIEFDSKLTPFEPPKTWTEVLYFPK